MRQTLKKIEFLVKFVFIIFLELLYCNFLFCIGPTIEPLPSEEDEDNDSTNLESSEIEPESTEIELKSTEPNPESTEPNIVSTDCELL